MTIISELTKKGSTIITDRKGIAEALNFGKHKVLKYDMDKNKGSIAKTPYFDSFYSEGVLHSGYISKDDGKLYFIKQPEVLKDAVSVNDYLDSYEKANSPILNKKDSVAVLYYSEVNNEVFVRLMRVSSVRPDCAINIELKDL